MQCTFIFIFFFKNEYGFNSTPTPLIFSPLYLSRIYGCIYVMCVCTYVSQVKDQ